MTGPQAPRDWDKELAQIDKLIASGGAAGGGASQGSAPVPAAAAAPPQARGRAAAAPAGRTHPRAILFTWLRLLLGLALGVAITQWPYVRGCGIPLFGYLVAVAGVIVAGLWSTVSSWRTRSGLAHVLSIGLFCWGAVLAAREVLPRIGYARAGATWLCPVGGSAAPTTPAPAAPSRPPGAF